MVTSTGEMPKWLKRVVALIGLFLGLGGLLAAFGVLCWALVTLVEGEGIGSEVVAIALAATALGAGIAMCWHALHSLQGRASAPMRLPPIWALVGVFGLCVVVGLSVSGSAVASTLSFPPAFLAAAALPPLWAVSWFTGREAGGLTWRRGTVALAGGATVSVFLALILEVVFPAIVLVLVRGLSGAVLDGAERALEALAGRDVASAVTHPGFIYLLIQVALVAPLAEELAKPLVTLPLAVRVDRRSAFWVGAMAGAGFAALENAVYAGLGWRLWAGILIVRALGGAIHPLSSGLVALAWRDLFQGEADAWRKGLRALAVAIGMHALWNGGSLLAVTLGGAGVFGELPPGMDVLGLSAAGTSLAVLVILGLAALWLGRAIGQRLGLPEAREGQQAATAFVLSDRVMAIWALACLVAIVPVGIAGLQMLR